MKLIRFGAALAIGTFFGIVLLIFGGPFAIGIALDLVEVAGGRLVRVSFWSLLVVGFLGAAIWRLRRYSRIAQRA